jgi:type IV fimbrial biogenesis protein FimT
MACTLRQHTGFTLLELIIAVAIGGILLGLAVPSMQSLLSDSEMAATSNEFVHSLQTARSEAIKRAGQVGLCPSTDPLAAEPQCGGNNYATGWIVFVDSDGNGLRGVADEVVVQAGARSPGFTFEPDNVFTQRVYFGESGTSINPAGVPLSGNIVISYGADEEMRTVRIAANGRIATQHP